MRRVMMKKPSPSIDMATILLVTNSHLKGDVIFPYSPVNEKTVLIHKIFYMTSSFRGIINKSVKQLSCLL